MHFPSEFYIINNFPFVYEGMGLFWSFNLILQKKHEAFVSALIAAKTMQKVVGLC